MALIDGKTIGIALSGGGFRATLFGLGSLWRLNDAGLLGRLDRVTSVSGGSILAGVLAQRWTRLEFAEGRAANFEAEVVRAVDSFCARSVDTGAIVKGWLTPFKSAADYLAGEYRKRLFGEWTLKQLPPRGQAPLFTFYATNMQTGRSFRFRQDMIADYELGMSKTTDVSLAVVVAASSAFPPFFSPITLRTDPRAWEEGENVPDRDRLRRRTLLADGGIYDNMGVESLVGNVDVALVSDAGAPFQRERDPRGNYVSQLARVRDILIDQTRALRKRHIVDDFQAGRQRGAYWGITTKIADYGAAAPLARDNDVTGAQERVPTRLAAFSALERARLINWGYALADAALRTFGALDVPPASGLPDARGGLA